MINKISVQNYKAFKNASIELKPITIFLGANSVGKSSIMKLLLLITQNANSTDPLKSALKINGETIQLGSFENIIHKKDLKSNLRITFHLTKFNILKYKNQILNQIFDRYEALKKTYYMQKKGVDDFEVISSDIRKDIINFKKEKKLPIEQIFKEMMSYQIKINNILKKSEKKSLEARIASIFLQDYSEYNKSNGIHFDLSNYKSLLYYLIKLDNHKTNTFTILYEFSLNNKKMITINKFAIYSEESVNIFSYELQGRKHIISSIYFEKNIGKKYSTKFAKSISFNQFQVTRIQNSDNNILINTIIKMISDFVKTIKDTFNYENINYVDPLRAYPRRYYFLDEKDMLTSLNKIDGEQMATMLKENNDLKFKVNKWIGKFNLNVDIEQLQDTIHNIKISQNGLSLDITDVGFGISQILPIITQGFFSKNNSTTLIEQPEIHLHPKMQSELADLFIDIIHNSNSEININKRIIIETHSEYLLKRLRRRIADTTVLNKDIAIYSFELEKESNIGIINKIIIQEKGAFDWPKDFYSTDMDDTIEFLKYQDK